MGKEERKDWHKYPKLRKKKKAEINHKDNTLKKNQDYKLHVSKVRENSEI